MPAERAGFLGWTLLTLAEARKAGLSEPELLYFSIARRDDLGDWYAEGALPHVAALALLLLSCGGPAERAIREAAGLDGAGYVLGPAIHPDARAA